MRDSLILANPESDSAPLRPSPGQSVVADSVVYGQRPRSLVDECLLRW
jgi:hypothetical protein